MKVTRGLLEYHQHLDSLKLTAKAVEQLLSGDSTGFLLGAKCQFPGKNGRIVRSWEGTFWTNHRVQLDCTKQKSVIMVAQSKQSAGQKLRI